VVFNETGYFASWLCGKGMWGLNGAKIIDFICDDIYYKELFLDR